MLDITAIGEVLIDFTPAGKDSCGAALFSRNPGGAPANVLAMCSALGEETAFIGKVGNDEFGRFLKDTLVRCGISVQGLAVSNTVPTTLAFVHLDERGDRSFSFYRNPGADLTLISQDIPKELLDSCNILHFGSVSLTDEPARSTVLDAVCAAKASGAIISYDPNYRPMLWNGQDEAVSEMKKGLAYADILKVSEEEMRLLTGETDLEKGAQILSAQGATLVLVTLGPKGAFYRKEDISGLVPTYDVKTVDTTGAGDAFWGAVLHRLHGKQLPDIRAMEKPEIEDILHFANAAGSLTTARKGSINVLPGRSEIVACEREVPILVC